MKLRFPIPLALIVAFIFSAFALPARADENTPCQPVTMIRFFPAKGLTQRMVGGLFAGSNDGKTTSFQTIAQIKELPPDGQWTKISLHTPVRFRYLKYEAPDGSWGNVAQIEFYNGSTKIAGTPFGTVGSHDNNGNDFSKALDGNTDTYFDGPNADGQYVGIDLGSASQAAIPEFSPKPGPYPDAQTVQITSATPGAQIRFTRDGQTPTQSVGQTYDQPIALQASQTLTAIAYLDGLADSPVARASYHIGSAAENPAQMTRATGPIRTFHIGNSFTDTVADWLKPVAESGGEKLDFHRFTIPGAPTDWLWEHNGNGSGEGNYLTACAKLAPIDDMFTQPYTPQGRSVDAECEYGGKFYEACRKYSPNVHFWFFQQWPSKDWNGKDKDNPAQGILTLGPGHDVAKWKQIALKPGESIVDAGWRGVILQTAPAKNWDQAVANHTRFFQIMRDEMARRYPDKPIGIIPGGPAMLALEHAMQAGKVPGMTDIFSLYADTGHLNDKGRYFISLVFYSSLFGQTPEGRVKPMAGLTSEQADIFQKIAWDTVKTQPWAGVVERDPATK